MRWTNGDDALPGRALPQVSSVTVLVPTRDEADNVQPLLDRLVPALAGLPAKVLFVDDSDDETPQRVEAAAQHSLLPVGLLHRPAGARDGGLGGAVLAGLHATRSDWVVVMDGDLQHPPQAVPRLLAAAAGADVVVASRHVAQGSSSGLAGWRRVLASGGATALAKAAFPGPLKGVSDPMSGFFAVRRAALDLEGLQPDGFKILLEVLVRAHPVRVREVGFVFEPRLHGGSKASVTEGLRFLRSLARLRSCTRRGRALAFAAVGASGIVVNLGLMLLLAGGWGVHYVWAAALATQGSSAWNALLTEHLVFADRAGAVGRRVRLLRSWLLNNASLLLRLPLLVLLVQRLHVGYLLASFLTLMTVFLCRFTVTDRFIYANWGIHDNAGRPSGSPRPRGRDRRSAAAAASGGPSEVPTAPVRRTGPGPHRLRRPTEGAGVVP
ncbi:MAG TPA: glycosyltransferase [Mycobacteriales bacterium]|nr:glycosyltransferase [Mycobacteriales bacterium]